MTGNKNIGQISTEFSILSYVQIARILILITEIQPNAVRMARHLPAVI